MTQQWGDGRVRAVSQWVTPSRRPRYNRRPTGGRGSWQLADVSEDQEGEFAPEATSNPMESATEFQGEWAGKRPRRRTFSTVMGTWLYAHLAVRYVFLCMLIDFEGAQVDYGGDP